MSYKNTREGILNQALVLALGDSAGATTERLQRYLPHYENKKLSFLHEKPWPFTLRRETQLTKATPPNDLGYNFVYHLPANTLKVLSVNPVQFNFGSFLSTEQALPYGRVTDDFEFLPRSTPREIDHIVQGRYLHAAEEVEDIIYQVEATEDMFPPDFAMMLVYTMAEYFAVSLAKDQMLAREMSRQYRKHHGRVVYTKPRFETDFSDRVVFNWYLLYYSNLYGR